MRASRKYKHIKFIVFPDDPFKDVWDITQSMLVTYALIFFPFQLAFMDVRDDEEDILGLVIFEHFTTIIFAIDIFINFISAYHDDNDNLIEEISKRSEIRLSLWLDGNGIMSDDNLGHVTI